MVTSSAAVGTALVSQLAGSVKLPPAGLIHAENSVRVSSCSRWQRTARSRHGAAAVRRPATGPEAARARAPVRREWDNGIRYFRSNVTGATFEPAPRVHRQC